MNSYQLLVAAILSSQTTDKKVNEVTPIIFSRYPNVRSLAKAKKKDLYKIIHSVGIFKKKSNYLIKSANILINIFSCKLPHTLKELVTLQGIGRKNANVIIGNLFNKPAITIDTHFIRIALRLRWVTSNNTLKIEKIVKKFLKPGLWFELSNRIIAHGRSICHSRKPACGICPLMQVCKSYGIGEIEYQKAKTMLR